MKCKNYFFSVLFVLFASVFGSFITNQENSFALSSYDFSFSSPFYSGSNTVIYSPDNNPYNFTPKYIKLKLEYVGSLTCSSTATIFTASLRIEDSSSGSVGSFATTSLYRCGSSEAYFDVSSVVDNYNPSRFLNIFVNSLTANDFVVSVTVYDDSPFASAPVGSLDITTNGTYDVTSYSEVVVNVPQTVANPYHDDLTKIYHAIIICGGIMLVLYFFYCIYRMIIKSTGGK